MLTYVLIGLASFAIGGAALFFARQMIAGRRLSAAEKRGEDILEEATARQRELLLEAKEEAIKTRDAVEVEIREHRAELQRQERRLSQKEENLDRRVDGMEKREGALSTKEREAENIRSQLEELKKRHTQQLELISKLSTEEAKQLLLRDVEKEIREEASRLCREADIKIKEETDEKCRKIIALAIQRCVPEVLSETTISVIPLPSDEMKGRLIGREGRNIRALEQATGVDLIIDDTPETVTISSFDPVRREVARLALSKLILDGRIHPTRIEEMVEKAKEEVEAAIRSAGEQAAYEAGVHGLHPELVKLLGRLKYRTSYGQNVIDHSLEVSALAGMIAAEIGADVEIAKKAGLLHDLGKAADHTVEGPHAAIGARMVEQRERNPAVAQAVAEHHGEAPTTSITGFIISTADAISGARLGVRHESLEQYIKRLESLENIANQFKGVEKSFAIQAGREIRVMVKPEEIDDLGAMRLSRDIVKRIEETLQYPGQIKVTVIRETRAVDYAK